MDSVLALHPANSWRSRRIFIPNSVNVVEINRHQHCLVLSGPCKKLDNVDRKKKHQAYSGLLWKQCAAVRIQFSSIRLPAQNWSPSLWRLTWNKVGLLGQRLRHVEQPHPSQPQCPCWLLKLGTLASLWYFREETSGWLLEFEFLRFKWTSANSTSRGGVHHLRVVWNWMRCRYGQSWLVQKIRCLPF